MNIRIGSSPTWLPEFYNLFGPRLIWGAIGIHCCKHKVEISWDFNKFN